MTLREGKRPIIFVAPHGFHDDDAWTNRIALEAAKHAKAYAVVNNGWERSEEVDAAAGRANCNNIYHLQKEVVCEEFLEPLLRFQIRCIRKFGLVNLFIIHGLSAANTAKMPDMDVILGFGDGKPPSYTMDDGDRELLPRLFYDIGIQPYIGMAGGKYSGWARPNLNQYFRKWNLDEDTGSVQIEVAYHHRTGSAAASLFGDALGEVALKFNDGDDPGVSTDKGDFPLV